MSKNINKCNLCPRKCNIDRSSTDRNTPLRGYCGQSNTVKLARAALHYYEEPCISGSEGSGAVFFSGCNLGCVFCQNASISHGTVGKEISISRLAEIFIELMNKGANNINLVTPTHYIPQIIDALDIAKDKLLSIPVVYNSSAYELPESLKLLNDYVDVYLPDFKYWDNDLAGKYSRAADYRDFAIKAIEEMASQRPSQEYDSRGIITKGVIVRHMVLPGHTKDSMKVIEYLYKTYGDSVGISLMSQYTPLDHIKSYPELNRKITKREYEKVVDFALNLGVTNAFIQEGDVAEESFIPEFDCEGI